MLIKKGIQAIVYKNIRSYTFSQKVTDFIINHHILSKTIIRFAKKTELKKTNDKKINLRNI